MTTLVVSTAITILLLPIQPHYVTGFLLTTIIQFIIFYVIGSVMEFIGELKLKEINAFKLQELSRQSMEVVCPCFKKIKEIIPIDLNSKNSYRCNDCGKTNSIVITAETAHTTEPVSNFEPPV
jgi:hypothetical protein